MRPVTVLPVAVQPVAVAVAVAVPVPVHVRLRALRLCLAPFAWLRLWLRLCPHLWLMHAVVRVLTRYNHQLHADVPPLRARLCLGHPRPGSAGGPGPGLQLHVGRGLCLRDLQRRFVLRIRVLFQMQQRRLGRQMCKYHIHKYHKAS